MRVAVIGGTGHIGSFLTPRLVEAGWETICVSRGQRTPYTTHPAWRHVRHVVSDRAAQEQDRSFGKAIRDLQADAVIDLTCYTLESAQHLCEALRGAVQHFLHCGTIWIHGPSVEVPTAEEQSRNPISDYGRRKLAIEEYLLDEARRAGFPATVLHPGHLVGPGWAPLNPQANFNLGVFSALAQGREVALPNLGMETVHHVHCADVAQAFVKALTHRSASVGESFHVVSAAALTLRGYAEAAADWFSQTARLRFLPWEEWKSMVSEKEANLTFDHIARSPNCSIVKAQRLLEYQPHYRSLDAVRESVMALVAQGAIETQ
jgi:nucleoside-diphosphate-sugar epimerase